MNGNQSITEIRNLPVGKMLVYLSWPVILSLVVQGLYSLVDSIWLARLGEQVLSAVSLSQVVQSLVSALLMGIATGMNAIISRSLGAGDYDSAKDAVMSGCAIQALFAAAFMACGIWMVPAYFMRSTTDAAVAALGVSYLRPGLLAAAIVAAQITSERLLQATGLSRYILVSQAIGSVVNLVLDPIFIFGLIGCPKLGIAGAAYATIIGQLIALLLSLYLNWKKNQALVSGCWKRRINAQVMARIAYIGIPTAMVGITASIGNYFINRLLISFTATANAAFGVYIKLQSVAILPSMGFNAGLVTMFSFYLGRRDLTRIRSTLKWGAVYVGGWCTICAAAFIFFPHLLMQPFSPTESMRSIGLPAFRIIGLTYLLSGYMTVLNSFYQATGRSMLSFVVCASRLIVVRVPVAVWLASMRQISLIWWCWPISEVVSDMVSAVCFIIAYKNLVQALSPKFGEKARSA